MRHVTMPAALPAIASCILFQGTPSPAEPREPLPSAADVVERYIDAVGGREAIEDQKTRVSLGRMIHDLHWANPPYEVVPITGYATSAGRVLMVEHKSDGLRCEGFDGEQTWVQDAEGVRTRTEPIRSKTAWLLDPQGALRLEEHFPDLEITASEVIGGRELYVLEPGELERAHYALYFDAETGLLLRVGYYWELRDYRELDGILIPFRIDMSRKGGSTTMVLDIVKHNLALEEVLFAVPDVATAPQD